MIKNKSREYFLKNIDKQSLMLINNEDLLQSLYSSNTTIIDNIFTSFKKNETDNPPTSSISNYNLKYFLYEEFCRRTKKNEITFDEIFPYVKPKNFHEISEPLFIIVSKEPNKIPLIISRVCHLKENFRLKSFLTRFFNDIFINSSDYLPEALNIVKESFQIINKKGSADMFEYMAHYITKLDSRNIFMITNSNVDKIKIEKFNCFKSICSKDINSQFNDKNLLNPDLKEIRNISEFYKKLLNYDMAVTDDYKEMYFNKIISTAYDKHPEAKETLNNFIIENINNYRNLDFLSLVSYYAPEMSDFIMNHLISNKLLVSYNQDNSLDYDKTLKNFYNITHIDSSLIFYIPDFLIENSQFLNDLFKLNPNLLKYLPSEKADTLLNNIMIFAKFYFNNENVNSIGEINFLNKLVEFFPFDNLSLSNESIYLEQNLKHINFIFDKTLNPNRIQTLKKNNSISQIGLLKNITNLSVSFKEKLIEHEILTYPGFFAIERELAIKSHTSYSSDLLTPSYTEITLDSFNLKENPNISSLDESFSKFLRNALPHQIIEQFSHRKKRYTNCFERTMQALVYISEQNLLDYHKTVDNLPIFTLISKDYVNQNYELFQFIYHSISSGNNNRLEISNFWKECKIKLLQQQMIDEAPINNITPRKRIKF